MLLSAVSVLVVAQSISETPEGLMNNPVYRRVLAQYGEHCIAQKNDLLLHENARLHSAAAAMEAIR